MRDDSLFREVVGAHVIYASLQNKGVRVLGAALHESLDLLEIIPPSRARTRRNIDHGGTLGQLTQHSIQKTAKAEEIHAQNNAFQSLTRRKTRVVDKGVKRTCRSGKSL